MSDLTDLTDEDLDALRVAVLTEQERRRVIADAAPSVSATILRYMSVTGATKADVEAITAEILAAIPEEAPPTV